MGAVKVDSAFGKRAHKFGAKRTVVDGVSFHSKLEADRWCVLRQFEKSGEITHLERQPRYPLTVDGELVATWIADFRYFLRPTNEQRGEIIVEDVKSSVTAKEKYYRLKMRLFNALYRGVNVVIVTKANADIADWRTRKAA